MHRRIGVTQNLLFFICWHIQWPNKMVNHTPILLLLAVVLAQGIPSSNGTDSYFISPRVLTNSVEVDNALKKITGGLQMKKTSYNDSNISYIMDNFTFTTSYSRNQQAFQFRNEEITFSGGRINFTYRFNFTKIDYNTQTNVTGYAQGSLLSDPFTYIKQVTFCKGYICWKLIKGQQGITLTDNSMTINMMQPYDPAGLLAMLDMLNQASMSIHPTNIKLQLLSVFNQAFLPALQNQLNIEPALDETINYSFLSSTHGEMNLSVFHFLFKFGATASRGQEMVFASSIEGWNEPICDDQTIQYSSYSYEVYGDKQDFHLHCFYQSVVKYLQSKGWLDIIIDSKWESDEFKLNADSLFEVVNNLVLTFVPQAQLTGSCTAQKNGLRFIPALDGTNNYNLDISYECSLSGVSSKGLRSDVLKMHALVKLLIEAGVTTDSLTFQILNAHAHHLSFQHVNNYLVFNIDLAKDKVNAALTSLKNTYTFGTGFPTLTRKIPKMKVEKNQVLYYQGFKAEVERSSQ